MATDNTDPLPARAMPAKKPAPRHRGLIVGAILCIGLALYLILDRSSFLHAMIYGSTPFSWDALLASLAAYGHFLFFIYIALAGAALFLENRNPDRTVAWLLVLALLPVVGFVLYWIVGPNFRYRADKRRFRLPKPVTPLPCIPPREKPPLVTDTAMLLYRSSGAPLTMGDAVSLFHDGAEAFTHIKAWLRKAERSIFVESFIIENDELGNEIKDILIERARAGVFVCVIYDAVGSWRIGTRYVRALKKAGVHAYPFLPVAFPMLRGANYRNHRKIMVIDGRIGLTGGLNIGNDYVSKNPKWSYWRDTHIAFSGHAVRELRDLFLNDLAACRLPHDLAHKAREASEPEPGLVPLDVAGRCPTGQAFMQIVASGPDTPWDTVQKGYFSVFARARETLWITTPYLVPGDALMEALCIASLSGVDVRLMLPGKGDSPLVHWASLNCCDELLRAGVRVFLYDATGFIHAKTLTCDGVLVSVGSANLDTRSLQINFEVQAFIYDKNLARKEAAAFERDMEKSVELTFAAWRDRPKLQKVKESIGKLFSSLL